jgi:hypothetical protein
VCVHEVRADQAPIPLHCSQPKRPNPCCVRRRSWSSQSLEESGVSRSNDARFQPRLHDFRHTFAVVASSPGIAKAKTSNGPLKDRTMPRKIRTTRCRSPSNRIEIVCPNCMRHRVLLTLLSLPSTLFLFGIIRLNLQVQVGY